jgi:arylsulfatase A-like enzyme
VGQVLEALRQTGHEESTLVIFTSDHGEGLGAHRWTGKLMFYDQEAAVPLIVSWKGVTPPKRIDGRHLVSTLDVLPTICDYAGVEPPPHMRGESLRAVIEKPDAPGHEFVVSEMAGGQGGSRAFMIRTKKYKYVVFPATGAAERGEMLFDMESDPGEMKNLAADAALASELERHRKLLDQWKKTTEEDKYPVKPNPVAAGKKGKAKK